MQSFQRQIISGKWVVIIYVVGPVVFLVLLGVTIAICYR